MNKSLRCFFQVQDDASRDDEGIEVEYVADSPELDVRDPVYAQFAQIFETFKVEECVLTKIVF